MPTPQHITSLIDRFKTHIDAYKSGKYNETQVRLEYINPFFEAMEWDVYNHAGNAEAYKDVVHEDAIKIKGSTKAPDYSFRIGGTRKFFLEAKKPSVNIKEDTHPAYQLRRYAWSARLPLSILTDFEEFAVYDCRIKPVNTDQASTARIMYLTFRDYPEKWDELVSIFSKKAILQGSFDKFAASNKDKRGTTEVNDAFLKEIETWREELARNLALRNERLTQRELNYAVQQTIDRIIFLRICEDRGVEKYGRLYKSADKDGVYATLCGMFQEADAKYNSGLFHFKQEKSVISPPDTLTLSLAIDDKLLKNILKSLYYPDSPYEFSVLSADILGQVYEQFLGKVVRLTEGHRAKIEEKPEVKKAGGVYYTPTYIVDYIVKHTVGELLKDKTPDEVTLLRILDPACGSGSFLIQAYQTLLDWHRDYYAEHPSKIFDKRRHQTHTSEWRLTTAERKRILLNNIYGVDIDPQAVEVTKLSLLLKVLEGESEETLNKQMELFQERALPDLGNNIKCGNSLIDSRFYATQQMDLLDEETMYRVNAFDWEKEFPTIFEAGGFDAVIGNPPYIRIQTLKEFSPVEAEYYKIIYQSASKGNYDIYVLFMEKGLQLLNPKAILGFILPHKFTNSQFGVNIRQTISEGKHLQHIVHFGHQQVFKNATTYTCLCFLTKTSQNKCSVSLVDDLYKWQQKLDYEQNSGKIDNSAFSEKEWNFLLGKKGELLQKLSNDFINVEQVIQKIFVGLQTSADKIYVLKRTHYNDNDEPILTLFSNSLNREVKIERSMVKPFLMGKDVKRYETPRNNNYVVFPYILENDKSILMDQDYIKTNFPLAWDYLKENKAEMENREKGKFKDTWWAYSRPQNLNEFAKPKIITPYIGLGCQMTFDSVGIYHTTKVYGIILKPEVKENLIFYLGIFNSPLLWFYIKNTGYTLRGGYFAFATQYLSPFPIPIIDFSKTADKSKHDQIVTLVESMLTLHQRLADAHTTQDKTILQRQIDATDAQIDRLVYELYGLTEDEIMVVEGGNNE